jgi:hypothetical protein
MAFLLPHHRLARLRPGHLGRRLHRAVVRPSVRQRHDLPVGRLHDRIILLLAHRHAACQGFYCGNFAVDVGFVNDVVYVYDIVVVVVYKDVDVAVVVVVVVIIYKDVDVAVAVVIVLKQDFILEEIGKMTKKLSHFPEKGLNSKTI